MENRPEERRSGRRPGRSSSWATLWPSGGFSPSWRGWWWEPPRPCSSWPWEKAAPGWAPWEPGAFPCCPWASGAATPLVRLLAPGAAGHGTEKVIEAIHRQGGRISLKVVPVKLVATVVTLACGGSAGKEGPCAQIGAGLMSAPGGVPPLRRGGSEETGGVRHLRRLRRGVRYSRGGGGVRPGGALRGADVLRRAAPLLPVGITATLTALALGGAPLQPPGRGHPGPLRRERGGGPWGRGVFFGLVALGHIELLQRTERRFRELPLSPPGSSPSSEGGSCWRRACCWGAATWDWGRRPSMRPFGESRFPLMAFLFKVPLHGGDPLLRGQRGAW